MTARVITVRERVAVLEANAEKLPSQFESIHEELRSARDRDQQIFNRLDKLDKALARYQGFWGAIAMVLGAVVTALTIFRDVITGWFKP